VDGILKLRNPLDLPSPENFRFLKKSSASALSKHASFNLGGGGKPNFYRERFSNFFDCREGESIYPTVKLNIDLCLDCVVDIFSSFLRKLRI